MDKVTSFFDLIYVDLYSEPRFRPRDKYFMWSELHQEFQEYPITEAFTWTYIQPFVEKEIVYVER